MNVYLKAIAACCLCSSLQRAWVSAPCMMSDVGEKFYKLDLSISLGTYRFTKYDTNI